MIDRQNKIATEALAEVQDQLDAAGVTATLDPPHWLTLSMPFARDLIHGQAIQRCAWELIERNGTLIGPAKIALTSNSSHADRQWSVEKLIDLPLDSTEDLSARISGAIVDLVLADTLPTSADSTESTEGPNLEELCASAGVTGRRRGDGSIAIALDLPGGLTANALLAHETTGEVIATVDLAIIQADNINVECRRTAAGIFLLQLAGLVRLVRPALRVVNDRQTLQLQSYLDLAPVPADLTRALEALSVAAQMSLREIAVLLHDESIAERWLALRGWSAQAALSA